MHNLPDPLASERQRLDANSDFRDTKTRETPKKTK